LASAKRIMGIIALALIGRIADLHGEAAPKG
jgi:hypothetical protein